MVYWSRSLPTHTNSKANCAQLFPTPHLGTSSWHLEIIYGGCIYITELAKSYKSGLLPQPPTLKPIVKYQYTTAFILSLHGKNPNLLPQQPLRGFRPLLCSFCLSVIASERPEFESQVSPLVAVELWTNYLISLHFNFPICKIVMIKTKSYLWGECEA